MTARIPADPSAIEPLERLFRTALTTRTLPENAKIEGVSALIHVDAYNNFSRALLGQRYDYLIHVTISNFGRAIVVQPNMMGKIVVYDSTLINNGSQELAGVQWVKTTFENTKIIYHGGDVYLSDVTFRNCTFDFGKDPQSAALLRRLQDCQVKHKPATLLYAQNNEALSKIGMSGL